MLKLVCWLSVFVLNFLTPSMICAKQKRVVEWYSDNAGLASNLMRAVEWVYCIKNSNRYSLFLNMNGAYGYNGNLFSVLFEQPEDPQIMTIDPKRRIVQSSNNFPLIFNGFQHYPTDGMQHFQQSKYVYMNVNLYKDPDFDLFRKRLHPIILQYFRPAPELQEKIDAIAQQMNQPSRLNDQDTKVKVGIHVRILAHYLGNLKSEAQFLDDAERDIDAMMQSKDPQTTQIFLATLIHPLVERLRAKYDVVVSNIPRVRDACTDWAEASDCSNLDAARDSLVDMWCLANCDEVWCGSSNMIIFAACVNPNLKICLLPSLEPYNGN